jgi:hypothetical protein
MPQILQSNIKLQILQRNPHDKIPLRNQTQKLKEKYDYFFFFGAGLNHFFDFFNFGVLEIKFEIYFSF